MIKLLVFKKRMLVHYNVDDNFCHFKSWKYNVMFPDINQSINCKKFLCCLPLDPLAIYSMKTITLTKQDLALIGVFPI